MTSVKDIQVDNPPSTTTLGAGSFVFTDDYSVFDWGKMPDEIPAKGASLCAMGAFNFELLEAAGIPTHYRGVIVDETIESIETVTEPPTEMAIELTQVPELPFRDGTYDYEAYHTAAGQNYLIPLEIVFRNVVPIGSSLRRRGTPAEFGLGLDEWPDEPVKLPDPIIEFSTKYEEQDRYLERSVVDQIAGAADPEALEKRAREVNTVLNDRAAAVGFDHQDGKIECLYFDGEIRVADVVGTFDENRFSYDGQQLSKEVLRQFYKAFSPTWVDAVAEAKTEADRQQVADWRSLCTEDPPPLPEPVRQAASDLYRSGANAYLDRQLFAAPSIEAAIETVRRHVA